MQVFYKALVLALGAVRRNAVRSILTALGILVGVAAVTIVVALGEGAKSAISRQIDSMGENSLTVRPQAVAQSGLRGKKQPPLTEADAEAIERDSTAVLRAAPVLRGFSQVVWQDANTTVEVLGATSSFFPIGAWKIRDGILWSREAESVGEKVCVVGATVVDELFGGQDPVGRVVRIGKYPFRVIGVLEKKGQSPFGQDQDNVLMMPVRTMRAKLTPTRPGQVHQVVLSAASPAKVAVARREATTILRQRHRLAEGAENDFRIRSQDEFRKVQAEILGVLRMLLLSIAGVSLVVGGIGVMNIMLVSVAERTREIGIRMAIGARASDILIQFLVEAVVLSMLGGALGALLAWGAIVGLSGVLNWPMGISPAALATALGTSSAVGIVFGFVPARRAAELDPIVALRRE